MAVLDPVSSPDAALAGLSDVRALYEEACASLPKRETVVMRVMDTPAERERAVRKLAMQGGYVPRSYQPLTRVQDALRSETPAEFREASRLSSRRVTPDRSEAQQHARRRDELGAQLVGEFNAAASALNAFFDDVDAPYPPHRTVPVNLI